MYNNNNNTNAQRYIGRNHLGNLKILLLTIDVHIPLCQKVKLRVAVCRGQIEVPVQEHDAKEISGNIYSQKPNSSVHLFGDAFSHSKTRSPQVFCHRILRLSHPENGTGSLISKMGISSLEKHAYGVRARTEASFTL